MEKDHDVNNFVSLIIPPWIRMQDDFAVYN